MEGVELLPGRASAEGTRRFAARFREHAGHFRTPDRLALSSLALGMRSGDPGGIDDMLYRSAVLRCLELGVNTFVTGLSERLMASERTLGATLERAFREGAASRDEVVVATRGGFLTPDPARVRTGAEARRYLIETYIETGLVDPDRISQGVHCLEPAFLRDQIRRSRANLRLATLDLYLLDEPELLLREAGRSGFRDGLRRAFEALEQAVRDGEIAAYGLATWDGLLRPHSDRHHVSITDVFEWALDVGGADHHLRGLQLPYGLAMGEALRLPSQLVPAKGDAPVLAALEHTGTVVLASAPLLQGRVLGRLPDFVRAALPGLDSDAQRCLQFVRSTPGVTSAVVGMREAEHVDENCAVARRPPVAPDVIDALFERAGPFAR